MSKKKKKNVKVDLGSNKTSNLIAIFALLFSAYSIFYTWKKDNDKELEYLRLKSERLITDEKVKFFAGGYPGMILPTYWSCDLTNNSAKTISILKYDLKKLHNKNELIYYSNINFGLYSQDFKILKLPLNIKSGETKRLLVKVGVSLYEKPTEILKKELDSFKNYKFRDIKLLLAKNNTDIFNNELESVIKDGRIVSIRYGNLDPNKDYYAVTFETGTGGNFTEILKWYPFF